MWTWALAISILGSSPEHITIAKFETRELCEQAATLKRQEYLAKSKEIVTRCSYTKLDKKGWW